MAVLFSVRTPAFVRLNVAAEALRVNEALKPETEVTSLLLLCVFRSGTSWRRTVDFGRLLRCWLRLGFGLGLGLVRMTFSGSGRVDVMLDDDRLDVLLGTKVVFIIVLLSAGLMRVFRSNNSRAFRDLAFSLSILFVLLMASCRFLSESFMIFLAVSSVSRRKSCKLESKVGFESLGCLPFLDLIGVVAGRTVVIF